MSYRQEGALVAEDKGNDGLTSDAGQSDDVGGDEDGLVDQG